MKLNNQNVIPYLKSLRVFPSVDWKKAQAREVTEYTNVNYVFSVGLDSADYGKVYLKQAFGHVKVNPDFSVPIERQRYEKLSIDYLQKYWTGRIPQVTHYDKKNNILIITDVGKGAKLLAPEIKKGRLHLEIGPDLGLMMAQLHSPTFSKNDYPVRDQKANQEHIDFIFDFRLRGARETLLQETEKLFQKSLKTKTSIIYGDWATKNIFVTKDNKVRLVDFENLVRFDPAFDLGYALAHWVLDITPENRPALTKFFQSFENLYQNTWQTPNQAATQQILKRAANYIGAMILHRLAGVKNTNRMEEYLAQEIPLIKIAKQFLQRDFSSPSAGLELISF